MNMKLDPESLELQAQMHEVSAVLAKTVARLERGKKRRYPSNVIALALGSAAGVAAGRMMSTSADPGESLSLILDSIGKIALQTHAKLIGGQVTDIGEPDAGAPDASVG